MSLSVKPLECVHQVTFSSQLGSLFYCHLGFSLKDTEGKGILERERGDGGKGDQKEEETEEMN